jgi:protein gp37
MAKIEWTEKTWNPVGGCRRKSPGCLNCYAERVAFRLKHNPNESIRSHYAGLTQITNGRPGWTGKTSASVDVLLQPLRRKQPTTYFISLSDLFYAERPNADIDMVFTVMALCGQHRFLILTKYAERMLEYVTRIGTSIIPLELCARALGYTFDYEGVPLLSWPIPNIGLGVSAENQEHADERIELLKRTPAAMRFVSYEPALGPVDFREHAAHIDWIIFGMESGPHARPGEVEWARSAKNQCVEAGTAFFLKQYADAKGRKISTPELDGQKWTQMPDWRRNG